MSHFDDKARAWDANPVFQQRADKIAAAMQAAIPLNTRMSALDYGCGTGMLTFPLRHALGRITCKDSSAGMIEVLNEKVAAAQADNIVVRQVDLTHEPLPAERYDLIYTSMVLHHIPDTDAILTTFHTLLNPGGWLAVADLDQEDGSFHGPEIDVHHGFDRNALRARAEAAGFAEVQFQTVFEIVKEQEAGPRVYPAFLMVARRP